jgi:pyruvate kinase
LNKTAIYRGVYPVEFDSTDVNNDNLSDQILQAVSGKIELAVGDKLILTHGDIMETVGASNTLKVLTVTKKHLK